MKSTVIPSDEPPQSAPEDPLLGAPQLPVVHRCQGDCSNCAVDVLMKKVSPEQPLHRQIYRELQQNFNRKARGFQKIGDEYVVPLHVQEVSFHTMDTLVSGCHRLINGQRVAIESFVGHVRHALEEAVNSERRLYIADINAPVVHASTDPKLIHDTLGTPLTEKESLD